VKRFNLKHLSSVDSLAVFHSTDHFFLEPFFRFLAILPAFLLSKVLVEFESVAGDVAALVVVGCRWRGPKEQTLDRVPLQPVRNEDFLVLGLGLPLAWSERANSRQSPIPASEKEGFPGLRSQAATGVVRKGKPSTESGSRQ